MYQKKKSASFFTVAALSAVPFVMVLGNSMLIPVLPELKKGLQLTTLQTSLIITLFSVPAGLAIPLAGYLSDLLGRRKVLIPALLLYGCGGLVAGLAVVVGRGYEYFIILSGRILQGIGAAGTAPIAMAFAGDLFQSKERARILGIMEAANGMGKVISPILGAALGIISFWAPFWLFPLIILPLIFLVYHHLPYLPPTAGKQTFNRYLLSCLEVCRQQAKIILSSLAAGMTVLLLLFGILFFLSEHLETALGYDGIIKGILLSIPVLWLCLASIFTGTVIKHRPKWVKKIVVSGLITVTAAFACLPLIQGTTGFFALISLMGIGSGITLPALNTLITSTASSSRRGLITSFYGGVRFLGVATGPPLFSYILPRGLTLMALIAAGLSFAVTIVFLLCTRQREVEKTIARLNTMSQAEPSPPPLNKVKPSKVKAK